MSKSREFIIDQVPTRFNQGPFWGNGFTGSLLYTEENVLRFTYDNIELWEYRNTNSSEPLATYQKLVKNPDFQDKPNFTYPSHPDNNQIFSTRLPALTLKLTLPSKIENFNSITDLDHATTSMKIGSSNKSDLEGTVVLNSCVNILDISLSGSNAKFIIPNICGWDFSLSDLAILKEWGYPEAEVSNEGKFLHLFQMFSKDQVAVISASVDISENCFNMFATITTGVWEQREVLKDSNVELLNNYSNHKNSYMKRHMESWTEFWQVSELQIPDERLQQSVDIEMYKLFCNARRESSPVTLQGIWNHDKALPAWTGDLHNDLNVQSCYWAAFKTGHVDLVTPYIKYYSDAIPQFKKRAKIFTGIEDAIQLPTCMNPTGKSAGSEWSFWNMLLGPELYAAIDFCWYYEYSQNREILRTHIYPYLKGVCSLYHGIATEGNDGYLHIHLTHSPEYCEGDKLLIGDDSTFIVSSLKYILEHLIRYEELLDINDCKGQWNAFLNKLMPISMSENGYMLMPQKELLLSHRHFSHLFPIYPLGQSDMSDHKENTILQKSLDTVINLGFSEYAAFSFPYLAILSARGGRGNMSRTMLNMFNMCFRSKNSFTVNGDVFQNGVIYCSQDSAGEPIDVFTLEAGLIVPAAVCEMMVHRNANTIFVLPAIPDEWDKCSCSGLKIEGGHEIDIKMENYILMEFIIHPGSSEEVGIIFGRTEGLVIIEYENTKMEINLDREQKIPIHLVKGVTIRVMRIQK